MVLVIRSGIGLLPLLCVRHGFAKKVIGLEQSACIEYARRIVEDNKYSNQITLIQSSVIFSYLFMFLIACNITHFYYINNRNVSNVFIHLFFIKYFIYRSKI